jgi:hypothetical protein
MRERAMTRRSSMELMTGVFNLDGRRRFGGDFLRGRQP